MSRWKMELSMEQLPDIVKNDKRKLSNWGRGAIYYAMKL